MFAHDGVSRQENPLYEEIVHDNGLPISARFRQVPVSCVSKVQRKTQGICVGAQYCHGLVKFVVEQRGTIR